MVLFDLQRWMHTFLNAVHFVELTEIPCPLESAIFDTFSSRKHRKSGFRDFYPVICVIKLCDTVSVGKTPITILIMRVYEYLKVSKGDIQKYPQPGKKLGNKTTHLKQSLLMDQSLKFNLFDDV